MGSFLFRIDCIKTLILFGKKGSIRYGKTILQSRFGKESS